MPTPAASGRDAPPPSGATALAPIPNGFLELSETERRVLAALSAQLAQGGAMTAPVTNRRIAGWFAMEPGEVEAIVASLGRMFQTDELPDDQQQDRLVERASASGLFRRPEPDRPHDV